MDLNCVRQVFSLLLRKDVVSIHGRRWSVSKKEILKKRQLTRKNHNSVENKKKSVVDSIYYIIVFQDRLQYQNNLW